MMQVDLPNDPVQMPDLIVEEGPMNQGELNLIGLRIEHVTE